MLINSASLEIASFFLLVAAFEAWERLRPARATNRLAELKLNLLSFALAVLMAFLARDAVEAALNGFRPGIVLTALDDLRRLPAWAKIALCYPIIDFVLYWIHWVQHRSAVAWRTHVWHHTPTHMFWLAGFRTSFMHSFIYNIPQTIVPMHLFHLSPVEAGIAYSIGLFIQFWIHGNVDVNLGWLKYVFIRPQDHRVHHAVMNVRGLNLGATFSVWDRLFGTYLDPDRMPAGYALGLAEPFRKRAVPRMLLGV